MSIYKYNLLKGYENLDRERQRVTTHNNNAGEAYQRLMGGKGSEGLNSDALGMYNQMENKIKQEQKAEAERIVAERKATPWLERTWNTAVDLGGRLVGGIAKFGENIVDLGATMFGVDEEWIKKDHVGEGYTAKLNQNTSSSYLNDNKVGKWVQGAAEGVGNLLPTLALSYIVPGVGVGIGTTAFMMGAAGGGMESALQQGATRGQAIGYGALAGLAEGAIEKLSGGIGGIGKGVMDKMISKGIGKSIKNNFGKTIVKAGTRMIGEGLEEVAMDAIDPLMASIYKKKVDYSGVNMSSLGDTFMTGAMTGGIMQGGQAMTRKVSPGTDIKMRLGEIGEQQNALVKKYDAGKLTEAQFRQGMEDVDYLRSKLVSRLDNSGEKRQDKIITSLGGKNATDKTVLDKAARHDARYDRGVEALSKVGVQLTAQNAGVKGVEAAKDSGIATASSSTGTTGVKGSVVTTNDTKAKDGSVATGVTAGSDVSKVAPVAKGKKSVSVMDTSTGNSLAMSPSLAVSRQKLEFNPTKTAPTKEQLEVIKDHGKLSGGKTKIVFTDDLGVSTNNDGSTVTRDGAYKDGVIYISTKTKNPMRTALVHEFDHAVNNKSRQHANYAAYVGKGLSTEGSAAANKYGNNADIVEGVRKDYGTDIDGESTEGKNTSNAEGSSAEGSAEKLRKRMEIQDEVTARYAEKLFSDQGAISRLARANKPKARRALGYITDKLSYLKSKKTLTVQEREAIKFLTTAEGLYRKAMRVATPGAKPIKLRSANDEEGLVQYYQYIDKDFKEYVEKIKNGEDVPKRYTLGKVSDKQVSDIKRLTGEDVSGYSNALSDTVIKHIIKDHGESGQSDQSMSKIEDIALMQYVLENYDHAELSTKKSEKYRNENNQPSNVIVYAKKIENVYYAVQAVTTGRYGKLQVETAYIGKKGIKNETPWELDAKSSNFTSDNDPKSVSINSMHQNTGNVNTKVSNQPKTVQNGNNTAGKPALKGKIGSKTLANTQNNAERDGASANQDSKPQYSQRRTPSTKFNKKVYARNDCASIITEAVKVLKVAGTVVIGDRVKFISSLQASLNNEHVGRGGIALSTAEGLVSKAYITKQDGKTNLIEVDGYKTEAEQKALVQSTARALQLAFDKYGSDTVTSKALIKTQERESRLATDNKDLSTKLDKARHTLAKERMKNNIATYTSKDLSTKLDKTRGMLTQERMKNNTYAYTKKDCVDIVNEVLKSINVDGKIQLDNNSDIVKKLYRALNSESLDKTLPARAVAKYIIDNAYTTYHEADTVERAGDIIEFYEEGILNKFNLEPARAEIVEHLNTAAYNAANNQHGESIEGIKEYLPDIEELGIELPSDTSAAEIFSAIYTEYKSALKNAKGTVSTLKDRLTDSKYKNLINSLAAGLVEAFNNHGSNTAMYKQVVKLDKAIVDLNKTVGAQIDLVKDTRQRSFYSNRILDNVRLLREMKRKGISAYIPKDHITNNLMGVLEKIVMRRNINRQNAFMAIKCLQSFYIKDRVGDDFDVELGGMINELYTSLENSDRRKADMTTRQLEMLSMVLGGVRAYIRNSDSVVRDKKQVSAREQARSGIEILQENRELLKKHKIIGFINKVFMKFRKLMDPRGVFALVDGNHKRGVFSWLFGSLCSAETHQKALCIQLTNDIGEMLDSNKDLLKRLQSKYVLGGVTITRDHAITALMTSKRTQAEGALYGIDKDGVQYMGGGFIYKDDKGVKRNITVTESDFKALEKSLTTEEKAYIKAAYDFFNKKARQVKEDADYRILGFTNVQNTYYIPIGRDDGGVAKRYADAKEYAADLQNVYNFSMNHATVEGARNAIRLPALSDLVAEHAVKVSTYATVTEAMRTFDKVMNANIHSGDPTKAPETLRSVLDREFPGMTEYIMDIIQDLQGAGRQRTSRILTKVKNGYVKAVLGLNPKSMLSQLCGIPAAFTYLSPASIAKGMTMKFDKDAYLKHSEYGAVREHDPVIVHAEGVSEKIGKFGELCMRPMQKMDNFMMHRFWNACQVETEKKKGLKIGSKENLEEAAKLYEFISRETQSNSNMSEKSALMRSESEIIRSFTMFSSDALKQLSRIIEHLNAWMMAKVRFKEGLITKAELKAAATQVARTTSAYMLSNAMFTGIALLFNLMLRKKDEDEKPWDADDYGEAFGKGMLESFISGLPIFRDIVEMLFDGYEIEHFSYSLLNDLVKGSKGVLSLIDKAVKGESVSDSDGMKAMRNIFHPIGMALGIPTKNIVKYAKMPIGWISPEAMYQYDSIFYPQHTKSLNAALDRGDEKMAKTVFGTVYLRDKCGAELSEFTLAEMYKLYALARGDNDITFSLAKSVPKKITYTDDDGNEREKTMTAKERKEFTAIYTKASAEVNKLVKSLKYQQSSNKEKAKAVNSVYDYYYNTAKAKMLKDGNYTKATSTSVIGKLMPPADMAILLGRLASIEPDLMYNGKVKPNSRKQKVLKELNDYGLTGEDKQIVLLALGYAPTNKAATKRAISRKGLTDAEQQYLIGKID